MKFALLSLAFAAVDAVSCGGVSNSISGDPTVDFTPTFVGSATFEGTCPCLDVSGGPASYQGVVVLMSDDPNLASQCDTSSVDFNSGSFHYLTIQVTSTSAVVPGTFTIEDPISNGPFATVVESRPAPITATNTLDFVQDDEATGSVKIDEVGTTVEGSFDALDLRRWGSTVDGSLSGSFNASPCQGPARNSFQSPCSACPG
jgi:hypothetical protein